MRVSLAKSERSFSAAPAASVLDAALAHGLPLPHSCKGGNCGACRARLLQGEVHYPHGKPLGLADVEIAEGFILLCQARAVTDLLIEIPEVTTPELAVIKRLPSRIERVEHWSHDVLGLFLRLPVVETFAFEPGQYLDIMLSGGRRRSFSIASPPHDSQLLELHVRRVAGGELTERLFTAPVAKSLLTIEGPLGRFIYRSAQTPLLLVGGGTGLAPLKSMLRHVLDRRVERNVTLYWGVRTERDLYAHAGLDALAQRHPRFTYRPVLSDPGLEWRGRRGWVHDAVLDDATRGLTVALADTDIYASGPPAMIAALRRDFTAQGADPTRLFIESFDYAPAAPARQRTSADSSS